MRSFKPTHVTHAGRHGNKCAKLGNFKEIIIFITEERGASLSERNKTITHLVVHLLTPHLVKRTHLIYSSAMWYGWRRVDCRELLLQYFSFFLSYVTCRGPCFCYDITLRAIRNSYKDTRKNIYLVRFHKECNAAKWENCDWAVLRRRMYYVSEAIYGLWAPSVLPYRGGRISYHYAWVGRGIFSFVFSWEHLREPHGQV